MAGMLWSISLKPIRKLVKKEMIKLLVMAKLTCQIVQCGA